MNALEAMVAPPVTSEPAVADPVSNLGKILNEARQSEAYKQECADLEKADPVSETPRTDAREIVGRIVADLSDRKGIGNEWEAIDDDIRDEICDTWAEIIDAALREQVAKLEAELFTAEHEQGSLLTRAERAEARAEAVPQLVEALQKIVNAADTFPFCPVGHLLEHSDINARAALDAAKEQSRG